MKTHPFGSASNVALITGASRGLGRQLAVRFGEGHWRIVVNFKERKQEAESVAQTISQLGGQAVVYQADVRNEESVGQMVEDVYQRWKRIDLLINNAGLTRDGLLIKMEDFCWDEVVDTNLKGSFHCIRAAAKTMMRQKAGHIINIASWVGLQGAIGQAAYAASKAGLIGLTKAAARELGPFGIQVNAVLPGFLPTEIGLNLPQDKREEIIKINTLGRSTTMEEVADFVYQLSIMPSTSGQVFNLDSRIAYY
jgi:3-oxoacyl-[acyl-carrier protein] reductase